MRVRDEMLGLVTAIIDGIRQCADLEQDSVQRMQNDLSEAIGFLPEESLGTAVSSLQGAVNEIGIAEDGVSMALARAQDLRAVIKELDVTYDVVFMPYNASMWDCMHTVWRAAKEDPRCRVRVVSVPYADRNPDGSVKEWHDHEKLFPPEVEMTPFTHFDLQSERPDVIYVHNPYDGYNIVTSVSPEYYSEELRKLARFLVYIPYWVSAVDYEEHFDLHQSFANFDKVIYQSEAYAQRAIATWSSSKIVPLGSPKFDLATASGAPVPRAWAKKIEGRKVLLQLTSVNTLLVEREKFVEKLAEVIDVLKGHDDLALWWRPHPLEQATVMSMAPGLSEAYAAVLKWASASDQVVLDDSVDLHRAIHAADAYYGGNSSVVPLFGLTGKPIVIQNCDIKTDERRGEAMPQGWIPEVWDESLRYSRYARYARLEHHIFEGVLTYLKGFWEGGGTLVPGQQEFFASLAAHSDGTAGERIHRYIMSCLQDM